MSSVQMGDRRGRQIDWSAYDAQQISWKDSPLNERELAQYNARQRMALETRYGRKAHVDRNGVAHYLRNNWLTWLADTLHEASNYHRTGAERGHLKADLSGMHGAQRGDSTKDADTAGR